jgi:hypothetical protein
MPFHRWPLGAMMLNTTVSRSVPSAGSGVAQDSVLLGAQALDRLARAEIEEARAEFDRDAAERFERVREQQQLAFGIDRRALHTFCVPRVADLETPIRGVDVEIARRSDDIARRDLADDEHHRAKTCLHIEGGVEPRRGPFRRRDARVPEPPELAVGGSGAHAGVVLARERLDPHVAARERHRFNEGHGRSAESLRTWDARQAGRDA